MENRNVKVRSQLTRYRYTVKDCVQSCRFSKNEPKNDNRVFIFHRVSLCWSIFYIADDVQAVLHDVQEKTQLFARCITGFTQCYTRLTGRSTGRLHDL